MTSDRITAPFVNKKLDEHLQKHELKIDPKLCEVYKSVFGEHSKDGLIAEVERMKMIDERLKKIEDGINKVLWTIFLAVIAALLKLVILP